MAVVIHDAITNSGAGEFTNAAITAGATGFYLALLGVSGTDASGRTSVSAGGVAMTLMADGDVSGRNVFSQLWFLDSAGIDSMVGLALSHSGGSASFRSAVQWTTAGGEQSGGTAGANVPAGNSTTATVSLQRKANSLTFAVGVDESTAFGNLSITNPAHTTQYQATMSVAYGSASDTANTSDTVATYGAPRDIGLVVVNVGEDVAGPTITGPDTTTEGAVTVQAGTLQDTITTQSLISGSYSIEQTIDSATATTLNYVAESGVNQCTPSTPVSGVPLAATITAAGITPYVVQQKADDGTNPPATRNITLNPEATHEVIQTMAGVANTNPDQSIYGSTWVTVEDNHQARVPKVVDGVTFTWNDKGEFTTDIDKTVTFQYELFSPASGNWSAISLTVKDTSIIAAGMVTDMVASMVSNMVEDM